ncbi:MAG: diguanylate cyclase [Candidatus Competibacter sp.]|nr:diguanylate cyclase [Candidatus Competibacter sp.]MDG4584683.1 diguanylate cyclase [Candidatus Competibacter sp.]
MTIFSANLDYVFFLYGLSFVLLGSMAAMPGNRNTLPWRWLAAFGFLHGLNEWLDLLAALSWADWPAFRSARVAVLAASYLPLVEFGRRGGSAEGGVFGWRGWLALALVAALGALSSDANGFNAACRYAFGLPGGVLAAVALWRASRLELEGQRLGLRLAAGSLLVYGVTVGLAPPEAPFFPASWLNQDRFLAVAGFPVQALRMACALGAMTGVWLHRLGRESEPRSDDGSVRRWWHPAGFVLLGGLGGIVVAWQGEGLDAENRRRLLEQAVEIAKTIQPEYAKALTFTAADRSAPIFERIRQQMIAYRQIYPVRGIYSMGLRRGSLVFGPESYAEDDPMASPPGTVYDAPHSVGFEVFRTGRPVVVGPAADSYGNFVSALAPVLDPRSGEVLMLVGLDVLAETWNARIAAGRLPVIAGNLVLLLAFLAGINAIEWRNRLPDTRRARWRHLETALVGAWGLLLAAALTALSVEAEGREHRIIFRRLADTRVANIRDGFQDIRANLEALVRFFQASQRVDREEFRTFVAPMLQSSAIQSYQWVPWVPAADREAVQTEARRDGLGDFTIWQHDAVGGQIPAGDRADYYPVYFAEPLVGNQAVLGFDLGSEPSQAAALTAAARDGLITATAPLGLAQKGGRPYRVLVAQPSFAPGETRQGNLNADRPTGWPRGFAVGVLRLQSMLSEAAPAEANVADEIAIRLLDLTSGDGPEALAAYPPEFGGEAAVGAVGLDARAFQALYPLFRFGHTYALLIQATPAFHAAHPPRAGGLVGLAGLLLVGVFTAFVGVLRNRQAVLEREVRERTAELRDSEECFHQMFERHDAVMLLIDPASGQILDANQAAARYYGYSVWRLRAMAIQDINTLPPGEVALQRQRALQIRRNCLVFQHRLANGAIRVVEVHSSPILLRSRPILFSIIHDITERTAQERKLRHLATTDPLTGLANRRQFLEQFGLELERFKRYAKPVALLMVDLDHFKQVNDQHGHAAGDAVLRHFAALARQALRKIDRIGRLGGEEFGALLPGTDEEGARQLAERLRKQVAESPAAAETGKIGFTVSIGITLFAPADTRTDSILSRADHALYRAKNAGRNRVEVEL